VSIFIFLIQWGKGEATGFFSILFSHDNVGWLGFLPMMFFVAYYTIGTMVDSVNIDEKERKIQITHRPLFLWERKITYCLDDNKFKFVYSSEKKTIKSTISRWNTGLFWTSLHFYRKGFKNIVILHDVCGWKTEQIEEIYVKLNKLSCHEKK